MRFFNYRFSVSEGISITNWYSPSISTWNQQSLPFINFEQHIDFGQRHSEGIAPWSFFRIRIGNYRVTMQFHFLNME